jgi:hypothetical protein
VQTEARLSKQGSNRRRAALLMPALVARRRQPNIAAFGAKLAARHKLPLQVLAATMRELLHASHGMWRTNTNFQGEKSIASSQPRPLNSTESIYEPLPRVRGNELLGAAKRGGPRASDTSR